MSRTAERSHRASPNPTGAGAERHPRAGPAVADISWDILLAAVAAYMLTAVARIHLLFPVLATIQITMLAGGGAVVLYAINHHPSRRLGALGSTTTALLAVFTGWMAFTVPWALRQHRSGMFVLDDFLKTVALYVLIVGCVRGLRDVERLAFVYFAGAAIYAAVILAQFNLGESWRLGDLITYDSNDFALFVVSSVPLGVYFLGDVGRTLRTKLLVGVGLGLMGVAFVQTGSRGGFVAMGAVAVFLLIRHRAVPLRWRIGGIGLLGLILTAFASQSYWDQMTTMLNPSGDYNFTAETGRIQIWKRGLGYLWDNPFVGVGPSNFQVAEGVLSPMAFRQDYGIGVPWTAPHNSFLQVVVELGIPGLLIFLTLLGSVFVMLRRMEKLPGGGPEDREATRGAGGPGDRSALAQALMGSLLGFLVGAVFLSLAYSAMLYALVALVAALWKTTRIGPDRLRSRTRLRRDGGSEWRGEARSSFVVR